MPMATEIVVHLHAVIYSKSMHISIPYSTIIFHAAVTAGFVRNKPQLIVVVLSLIVVVMGSAF